MQLFSVHAEVPSAEMMDWQFSSCVEGTLGLAVGLFLLGHTCSLGYGGFGHV